MGMSKAIMEKVAVAKSREVDCKDTIICCTRYGNVMGSRVQSYRFLSTR